MLINLRIPHINGVIEIDGYTLYTLYILCTFGKNIIATTKIRNNYGAIQSFIFPILR